MVEMSQRLNRTEAAIVFFYAPWSRSSIQFRPIFEHLATKHAQQNFEFIAVNCWQPGPLTCRQSFSLRGGYPYLSIFTHATGHIFYTGVLSEAEILHFIYKYLYPFYQVDTVEQLGGLRLLSDSSIIITVARETRQVEENANSIKNIVGHCLQSPTLNNTKVIPNDYYLRLGMRSVMVGAISAFVPLELFPNLNPGKPYFYMPDLSFSAVPTNWTGWLPPIHHNNEAPRYNSTQNSPTSSLYSNRGSDRAVVAVVNSFMPSTGPKICNPGVALVKAASWLYDVCLGDETVLTKEELLTQVATGLALEEQQCQYLRHISHPNASFQVFKFEMLRDGGAELKKLGQIIGLGCSGSESMSGYTLSRIWRDNFDVSFDAVEKHAGVGVIFNKSATSTSMSHLGPRKPIHIDPALYLLDGRQESPVKMINVFNSEHGIITNSVHFLLC